MTYTNELEVKVDFSDVDPNLLEELKEDVNLVQPNSVKSDNLSILSNNGSDQSLDLNNNDLNTDQNQINSNITGRAAKFFKKKD